MPPQKLSTYRKKRDFEKTPEPSGDARVAVSQQRRFVIQKHDATRLHYDLRLEFDGVFKSWAVTRGPSLDPHDKRLAVEVEDHPLDYGDFEGTIPEGQYGGGTVMLWDRGYWIPEGNRSPEEALAAGDLKFSLEGRKLHGSWVLVRMKGDRFGGKRTNWLLIKHKDQFARPGAGESVLAQDRSVASNRSLDTIAAGKGPAPKPFMLPGRKAARADAVWQSNRPEMAEDRPKTLRARISAAARGHGEKLQQIQPRKLGPRSAPMPDFIEPQLCKPADHPPRGSGWGHEVKFDGYRIQMRVDGRHVTLKTRAGLDWTRKFPAIARAAARLPDAIIDGEVAALDDHGAPDFSALQAALSEEKTEDLIFFAFDLMFEGDQDLRDRPLSERKQHLQALLETLR
ncbi:MAG TPA: DNA polymerase ligase N-terminal domain-containing protein, partial [Dongiaceae bacterium]